MRKMRGDEIGKSNQRQKRVNNRQDLLDQSRRLYGISNIGISSHFS